MTATRTPKPFDATERQAMIGRQLRALARRSGEGDEHALAALVALQDELQAAITEAGAAAHASGYSYTFLGQLLGVSRQAARQRFSK